ncbi:V-type ATPase, D subunit [Vavraia culicis subsp. floridensis]|uniref:V-type ATPase, D subunit n=1 Tax=Vavraia culicis (isolate floridensis) TaxID=948595 RepID=L2GYF2_VAVCU|nr:V-type ATPase, D subunit [Vavraia culicis subsp. floridensis]ELA48125.2 V-type ATPase, D subunit [Vavraia culicis subsp. floridensis]
MHCTLHRDSHSSLKMKLCLGALMCTEINKALSVTKSVGTETIIVLKHFLLAPIKRHPSRTTSHMSNQNRLSVFPTRMNLTITKNRLKSAEKGYSLLKRKSEALQVKHREIQQKLNKEQDNLKNAINNAYYLLAKAEFLGSNIKMFLYECSRSPISVESSMEQVSGVFLPVYSLKQDNSNPLLFLDKSGSAYLGARNAFKTVIGRLIELASLKNSFVILDEVLKNTNRRVNALDFMLIPRINNTIDYINAELDEQDREEFFRLKKIQKSKKKS